jgi:hypothetical protein
MAMHQHMAKRSCMVASILDLALGFTGIDLGEREGHEMPSIHLGIAVTALAYLSRLAPLRNRICILTVSIQAKRIAWPTRTPLMAMKQLAGLQ